ncbi:NADH-ubiquinone oxidoreductase chain 5 [Dendrobium catenatum]|uniref:NADH-ubiquinone oxidoreductase chain 5 n=1 Tax=Dendrobium catenatum TaxID=906689 RepID=A0A2I0VQT6_9ASPA|nr:NADH-ubiquinone oxidoreductase chain 5 [Dendrobium catenatum]
MYPLIVFLPLLGSSIADFFGRFLGSEGTAIITTTCISFLRYSLFFIFMKSHRQLVLAISE